MHAVSLCSQCVIATFPIIASSCVAVSVCRGVQAPSLGMVEGKDGASQI
jgi:hypothetical protein